MSEISPLTQYDSAKRMLHQAVRVDEVMHVRDVAERIALYGKQAKDRGIMADAMELQQRAERKLGALIASAKAVGQIGIGRPAAAPAEPVENGAEPVPFMRLTLAEVGIDKKLSASAQKLAQVPDEVFEAGIEQARNKIVAGAAAVVNPAKDMTTADKKAARAEKEARLGAKQRALPEAKFGVIYADPEWQFETYAETGMNRSAENHYPTSTLDVIKKRDAASLAADDCVLFLWATAPMLPQALEVMEAWGFVYKSHIVWRKAEHHAAGLVLGTGYWFRNGHELLLVGTRGHVPAPAMGTQWPSVMDAPPRKHSEKPDWAYELIEGYFPSLPKVELNARRKRAGWVTWGYEAPENAASEPVEKINTGKSVTMDIEAKLAAGGDPMAMTDAAIRAGYALEPFDMLPIVAMVSTIKGRVVNGAYVRKRAHQLGLGSRDRQKSAASAFASAQHVAKRSE
jgi:N6-adenosine-specific RNA methylase IME4